MSDAEFWTYYGLPAFGVAFGLVGLAIAWLAARRFDARYGTAETPAPVPAARPSPYRRPQAARRGKAKRRPLTKP